MTYSNIGRLKHACHDHITCCGSMTIALHDHYVIAKIKSGLISRFTFLWKAAFNQGLVINIIDDTIRQRTWNQSLQATVRLPIMLLETTSSAALCRPLTPSLGKRGLALCANRLRYCAINECTKFERIKCKCRHGIARAGILRLRCSIADFF